MALKEELKDFIVETFLLGDDSQKFDDKDSFIESGIIDSTGVLELITHLEEKYGIEIDEEEMVPDNLDSLSSLERFINLKVSEK